MRRLMIALIAILFGCASHAQTTFFVKPIIEKKVYLSSNRKDKKFGFSNIPFQNDYFTIRNKAISTREDIPMGVSIGVSLKNDKHILSLGFAQDGVGSSAITTSLYKSPIDYANNIPMYYEFTSYNQSLHFANRYFLDYRFRINKSINNKFYINSSISYLSINTEFQNVVIGDIFGDDQTFFYHNNAVLKQTEYGSNAGGSAFMLGVGFSGDIGISINSKWHYFFSLSTEYKQGLVNSLQNGYNNYVIKDNDNLYCFHYETQSRGSGIYFELSRRFQLYPWKKKSKNKELVLQ